jgi:NADH dehydrogenase
MITFANIPETSKKRIVIIGAGFAGLLLARKIDKKLYQIVLVDKNNYHQFQPLFYQVATAGLEPSAISFPLRKVFHKKKDIHIRVCEVKEIMETENCILTDIGRINFDYLVIATGADTNFYGNQEIMNHALPMKSVSEALYIRNQVLSNFEMALVTKDEALRKALLNIVVVGGGPTGVEVSGTLADMKQTVLPKDYPELDFNLMTITLVEGGDRLLGAMNDVSSKHAKKFLEKRGVQVLVDKRVSGYDGDEVTFSDGEKIPTKTLIWAAGVKANHIPGLRAESLHKSGRIMVNAFNQVNGYEHIFSIGDVCIMLSDEKFKTGHPQIAQPAMQQGELLAKNLKMLAMGKPMQPFAYKDLGSMATVGRNFAVVELPFYKFQGFRAWMFWMLVHLMSIVGVKNRLLIFINWVWNYISYDQSLRLIIKPRQHPQE